MILRITHAHPAIPHRNSIVQMSETCMGVTRPIHKECVVESPRERKNCTEAVVAVIIAEPVMVVKMKAIILDI